MGDWNSPDFAVGLGVLLDGCAQGRVLVSRPLVFAFEVWVEHVAEALAALLVAARRHALGHLPPPPPTGLHRLAPTVPGVKTLSIFPRNSFFGRMIL